MSRQIDLSPGEVATFADVSWDEFDSILQELGETRSSRIAYSHKMLEIMVPSLEQGRARDLISDMVKLMLKKSHRRYEPFGSSRFAKDELAAVEPDASFYIKNYQQMIGHRRLEPTDPPPDLAIETNAASQTTLDAYLAIGVPELWIYDGKKLTIYLLENDRYISSEISPTFPDLLITRLVPGVVARSWDVGSLQALEEFEEAIGFDD